MSLDEKMFIRTNEHYLRKVAKRRIAHSKRVAAICREIVSELECEFDIDTDLLYCAAQVHDIRKLEENKKHHKKAKKALKKELGDEITPKELKQVCRVISEHKGKKFEPEKKKIALEAAILRMADKIDRIEQKKPGAVNDYWESLERIETYFGTKKKFFYAYDAFEEACETVRTRRQRIRLFLERGEYNVAHR